MNRRLRCLLRGRARGKTSKCARETLCMPTMESMTRTRRLGLLRRVVDSMGNCQAADSQIPALLMGKQLMTGHEQLAEGRAATEFANPWLSLWLRDVDWARNRGVWPNLSETVEDWRGCLKMTPSERKQVITFESEWEGERRDEIEEQAARHICHLCGRLCADLYAVRRHITMTHHRHHWMNSVHRLVTSCNVCTWCNKAFTTTRTVSQHMQRQIMTDSCPESRRLTQAMPEMRNGGKCGRCNKNMKNLAQLLNHIRTNRWKGECAPEGGANEVDAREDSSGSVLAGDESSA